MFLANVVESRRDVLFDRCQQLCGGENRIHVEFASDGIPPRADKAVSWRRERRPEMRSERGRPARCRQRKADEERGAKCGAKLTFLAPFGLRKEPHCSGHACQYVCHMLRCTACHCTHPHCICVSKWCVNWLSRRWPVTCEHHQVWCGRETVRVGTMTVVGTNPKKTNGV